MVSLTSTPVRAERAPRQSILGLLPLTALVVGSMIGGGVFSLPQNMAKGASAGAALLGWIISGIGIFALAWVYRSLAMRKPELDAGPYAYARAGFGDFVGFSSAWGYWLSAWIGNVSYAVLIFGALSYFFPVFGTEGNTWQAIVGASILLWAIHALILAGVRQAAIVNIITTFAKLVPIALFILILLVAANLPSIGIDFWGAGTPALGSVLDQVKSTMLVTLWVFIGIEGASVESARAERRADIGRATMFGFVVALLAYVLVSLLSFAAMSPAELAGLPSAASMANVLEKIVGPWGSVLIRLGLVVSVLGAFLSWTLFAAEIPYRAAKEGMMPEAFSAENESGSPAASLWITNILVQLFLLLTLYSNATYQAIFYISATAILVPYVLSGAYALKLALAGERGAAEAMGAGGLAMSLVATVYGLWLVYAAGLSYLFMVALLYAPGVLIYWWARREHGAAAFKTYEAALAIALIVVAAIAGYQMWAGSISAI